MFASVDEDLLESTQPDFEQGELPPKSSLLLETGPYTDLDFVIWYHLYLYSDDAKKPPLHLFLNMYKGGPDTPKIELPFLRKLGRVIEFRESPEE
jgi:hypothetical protein